jgi:AcrR family transcriptional regulator
MPRYSERQKAALDALMKDDVYNHAMEIITAEGLGTLTMERLATEVGVSRSTLYNYFADRDAVINYLEERTFAPILAAINELVAGPLSADRKLAGITETIFAAVHDDLSRVVALVPAKRASANREFHQRRRDSALSAIESVIREGIETGLFRELSPRLVAKIYLDAVAGMVESMAFSGTLLPPDELVPTLVELLLGGLRVTPAQARD